MSRSFEPKILFPELMGAPVTAEEAAQVRARADEIDAEYGEDFDISRKLLSAKDPLTGRMRDLKVDDRDLPLAKNYYDWCTNTKHKFTGKLHAPWVRQMIVALIFFGEVCPRCSKKSWLRDITNIPKTTPLEELVERVQLLEHGVCPSCNANKLELYKSGEMRIFQELVLVWGQRSGKSTSLAMMAAYHTHRFLKLPPFGSLTTRMQSSTPLTFSFVSLTYGKAVAVLWEPVLSVLDQCDWYTQYFELMDHYGRKYGVELYNKKLQFIRFSYKNLNLVPSHPGWEALRGETRFGAALDELGLFPLPDANSEDTIEGDDDEEGGGSGSAMNNNRKMANADEAHKSLMNSLVTVNDASADLLEEGLFHIPNGLMFGVSSPQSHRDKVMRLLRESQTEEGQKTMYGSQLPTWEVHPKLEKTSPVIARLFASNPEKAERDFGANPPRVHSVYIRPQIVQPCFSGPRSTHTVAYDYSQPKINATLKQRTVTETASVLSIDAGLTNNSFTLCSSYFDFKTGKTHTTTVLEVIPGNKKKINFNSMYEDVILPLAKATNAAIVLADQWNSEDILSRIETDLPGVTARKISPRRKHFDAARQLLVEGNVILPRPEIPLDELFKTQVDSYRKTFLSKPVSHLAYQMSTVRDLHPQRPPEKPEQGTDDIFRAWVLGVSIMHQPKVQKLLQEMQAKIDKRRASQGGALGMYVPRGAMGYGG